MNPVAFTLSVPSWLATMTVAPAPTQHDRMRFVIDLAQRNIDEGTGGPFAAAVFSAHGDLIAAGVNVVVPQHAAIAHAEIMAIALANAAVGSHRLDGCALVTTVEPCAMCLGAVMWSGVSSLVTGARGSDAEAIGFDEGPKPPDWAAALRQRGITVTQDVCRDEAAAVLQEYSRRGGMIYNG